MGFPALQHREQIAEPKCQDFITPRNKYENELLGNEIQQSFFFLDPLIVYTISGKNNVND
jgi:hypothetical protein